MKRNLSVNRMFVVVLLLLVTAVPASSREPIDDRDALAGLATPGRAFFDINIGVTPGTFDASMKKLALYLDVIRQTYEGLQAQAVEPDMVVVFRGSAVLLVTDKASAAVKELIADLAGRKIGFEACGVATNLTATQNDTILPEVKVVGNTFISAIGYQTKGYNYILIQ